MDYCILKEARRRLDEVEKKQKIEEYKLGKRFNKEKLEIKKLIRSIIWSTG